MKDADSGHRGESTLMTEVLGRLLVRQQETCGPAIGIEDRPFPFVSSFPLRELTVTFEDNSRLELLFKDASPETLPAAVRSVRPSFLEDPLREIEAYRSLLNSAEMGTPHCHGWHIDESNGRYWLFLEKVHGTPLSMTGDFEVWKEAVRHLARLHVQLSGRMPAGGIVTRLIRYDKAFYEQWLQRAVRFHSEESGPGAPTQESLRRLAGIHPLVLDELLSQPPAVIHGEMYASNILVASSQQGLRICSVDWERTAFGPPLMDVAALTAGRWPEERKQELIESYRLEREQRGHEIADRPDLLRQCDLCRIQLALQWLGWSPHWQPPPEHRQDWLLEAIRAARRCGFNV